MLNSQVWFCFSEVSNQCIQSSIIHIFHFIVKINRDYQKPITSSVFPGMIQPLGWNCLLITVINLLYKYLLSPNVLTTLLSTTEITVSR